MSSPAAGSKRFAAATIGSGEALSSYEERFDVSHGGATGTLLLEERFDVSHGFTGTLLLEEPRQVSTGTLLLEEPRSDGDQGAREMGGTQETERFERAVNERAEIIAAATDVLGLNFQFGYLKNREIRVAALRAMGCTRNFDDASDDTVEGWFDGAMSVRKRSGAAAPRKDSASSGRAPTYREAQTRLDAVLVRPGEPGAPAWQQPTAVNRCDEREKHANLALAPWQQPLSCWKDDGGEVHGTEKRTSGESALHATVSDDPEHGVVVRDRRREG